VGQTDGPTDLESYRNTYAEYKMDPDLQDAHAMHPFEVIPDDHEVYNNWSGFEEDPEQSDGGSAALLAYWEHMPLRPSASPHFAGKEDLLHLYREIDYGDLALFAALDTRQYRGSPPRPRGRTRKRSGSVLRDGARPQGAGRHDRHGAGDLAL
jgi:alkaline phosphatase D